MTTDAVAPDLDAPIRLPGSDVSISVMGLGTWAWGDRSTWGMDGYDSSYNFETIRAAYAARDRVPASRCSTPPRCTATARAKRIIGRLLREDPARTRPRRRRDEVHALSVAHSVRRQPDEIAARLAGAPRAAVRAPVPDPRPDHLRSARTVAAALAAPYRPGLIKAVGVSNYSESEMRAIACRAGRRRHPARDQPGRVLAAAHDAGGERHAARLPRSRRRHCSPIRRWRWAA